MFLQLDEWNNFRPIYTEYIFKIHFKKAILNIKMAEKSNDKILCTQKTQIPACPKLGCL